MSDYIDYHGTVRDGHVYLFVLDTGRRDQVKRCLQTLGRFASDPSINFSWVDAARISNGIRESIAADSGGRIG